MRKIRRIASAAACTGLLAFGGITAGAGAAHAATPAQVVTSCSYGTGSTVVGGVTPNCTSTGTVKNPTDLEINLNPNGVLNPFWGSVILKVLGGIKVSYSGSCVVDGSAKAFSGSYTATSNTVPSTTVLDLQKLVGSPAPSSCVVTFAVSTIAAIPTVVGITPFNVSASVQSVTTVPGAIWQGAGTTSQNASAAICADDTGNGFAGTVTQVFTCLSDLADRWAQTGTGQFVHNGDCLTGAGNSVTLQACAAGNVTQYWTAAGTSKSEIVNKGAGAGHGCLTAPSYVNMTPLTLTACTGAANQLWTSPGQTPGSGS